MTQEEMARFLDAAQGERIEDALILALHTGLRPGEWLGLTWDAVDWDAEKLTVRQSLNEVEGNLSMGDVKTSAGRRTISLSGNAVAALKRQRKRQLEDRLLLVVTGRTVSTLCSQQGRANRSGGQQFHVVI